MIEDKKGNLIYTETEWMTAKVWGIIILVVLVVFILSVLWGFR